MGFCNCCLCMRAGTWTILIFKQNVRETAHSAISSSNKPDQNEIDALLKQLNLNGDILAAETSNENVFYKEK
jgi:hypothetical protein